MVGIIGVAVSILAVIVVINGGGPGTTEAGGEAGAIQTAHYELTEFSIEGDNPIGSGPTRF